MTTSTVETRVTLGIKAIGLALTLATVIFFAGRLVDRLDNLSDGLTDVRVDLRALSTNLGNMKEALHGLETTLVTSDATKTERLKALEQRLERLEKNEPRTGK